MSLPTVVIFLGVFFLAVGLADFIEQMLPEPVSDAIIAGLAYAIIALLLVLLPVFCVAFLYYILR